MSLATEILEIHPNERLGLRRVLSLFLMFCITIITALVVCEQYARSWSPSADFWPSLAILHVMSAVAFLGVILPINTDWWEHDILWGRFVVVFTMLGLVIVCAATVALIIEVGIVLLQQAWSFSAMGRNKRK